MLFSPDSKNVLQECDIMAGLKELELSQEEDVIDPHDGDPSNSVTPHSVVSKEVSDEKFGEQEMTSKCQNHQKQDQFEHLDDKDDKENLMDVSPDKQNELTKIADSISIAKRTRNVVWQNIFFIFFIKLIFIVLGSLGLASLWGAVFASLVSATGPG